MSQLSWQMEMSGRVVHMGPLSPCMGRTPTRPVLSPPTGAAKVKAKMGLGERAFKKAITSRAHRERAQPAKRAKLGLLEKHKDYVERARNYHRKQDALKALRTRAANRNPDEFHFGMIKSRMIVSGHL